MTHGRDEAHRRDDRRRRAGARIEITAPGAYDDRPRHRRDVERRRPRCQEGEIRASAEVLVVPLRLRTSTSTGTVEDGRRCGSAASLDEVDLAKVEAAVVAGDVGPGTRRPTIPTARPVPAPASRYVTELVPSAASRQRLRLHREGRPAALRVRHERKPVKTAHRQDRRATGAWLFSLAVPDPSHQYEVAARRPPDHAGRSRGARSRPARRTSLWRFGSGVQFETADGRAEPATSRTGSATARDLADDRRRDARPVGAGRSLPLHRRPARAARGATVTDSATFERTFDGGRRTGHLHHGRPLHRQHLRPQGRRLGQLRSAGACHRGDRHRRPRALPARATTSPSRSDTTDAKGRPVAASVVLQAVDEKLFAMGARLRARSARRPVRAGRQRHRPPDRHPPGAGWTPAPRARAATRPAATAKADRLPRHARLPGPRRPTPPGGRRLTVHLSDDLTSWHVAVSRADGRPAGRRRRAARARRAAALRRRDDRRRVPARRPADHPAPGLRRGASGPVTRSSSPSRSTSLGLAGDPPGRHRLQRGGLELPGAGARHATRSTVVRDRADALRRRREAADGPPGPDLRRRAVPAERRPHASSSSSGGRCRPQLGDEAATYTFTDAGSRPLRALPGGRRRPGRRCGSTGPSPPGRPAACSSEAFGRDPATLPPDTFDPTRYPLEVSRDESGVRSAGAALLPYGGVDPWLAARVAILAPHALDAVSLRDVLIAVRDGDATRRDLRIAAVAGLSALGEPVADDLDAAGALERPHGHRAAVPGPRLRRHGRRRLGDRDRARPARASRPAARPVGPAAGSATPTRRPRRRRSSRSSRRGWAIRWPPR